MFAAQRGADGAWVTISYAQMLDRARRIGQALATRGLSPERPIAILSDNELDHLTLSFAAQWVGVPFAPISAAYSTVSQDFAKLRHILGALQPGLGLRGACGAVCARHRGLVCRPMSKWCWARVRSKGVTTHLSRRCWTPRPAPKRPAGACAGRAGHDRQVPVHLGLDEAAQGA